LRLTKERQQSNYYFGFELLTQGHMQPIF